MVYSTSCMPTPTATASGGMRSCRSPMWPGALQARTYPSLGHRPADSPATFSIKPDLCDTQRLFNHQLAPDKIFYPSLVRWKMWQAITEMVLRRT